MATLNQQPVTGLSAKTASARYPDATNSYTKPFNRFGCHVVVNVTSGCNSTDKFKIQIIGLDSLNNEYLLLDGTDITANQPFVFKLAPFVVQSIVGSQANGLSDYLPDNFVLRTVHSTAAAITYSISINFV